jgi:hypothetical protein
MGSPRDRLDDWLNTEVEPLPPAPGTFDRIRLRARRRKASRVVMSAAGVVVVVAAGVAIPRIATSLQGHNGHGGQTVAAGTPPPSARPNASGTGPGSLNSKSSSPVPPSGSALSAQGSGTQVPPNFQPTSVTFVGPHIGAVIGQAGTPGHCATKYCTSLAGTSDYGSTWYGVSAPVTGPPDGSTGVSQIRFLDTNDGWAFGPQLWVTHDGGATWAQEPTKGMRVTDLETVGDRAFALFATCAGKGAAYAADCTSFALYTSVPASNQWQLVSGPTANLPAAGTSGTGGAGGTSGAGGTGGQAASASLVLTGGPVTGRGYLLAPSGELLSGPLTGAAWTVADQQAPCQPGTPGSSGQPAGGLLAADSAQLVLVCTSATSTAGDSQTLAVYESSDDGAAWSKTGSGAAAGIAASLAIQAQGGLVLLATDAGLFRSTDGGGTWQRTQASPGGAATGEHGFRYVGMTSPLDGVALPADADLHEVFITTNGGLTWRARAVSSP